MKVNSDKFKEKIINRIKEVEGVKDLPLASVLVDMLCESLYVMDLCSESNKNNRALVLHRDQDYLGKGLPLQLLLSPDAEIPRLGNVELLLSRWLEKNPDHRRHREYFKDFVKVSLFFVLFGYCFF